MAFPEPLNTLPVETLKMVTIEVKSHHKNEPKCINPLHFLQLTVTHLCLPNISSDTGVLKISPVNSHVVCLASIPDVPSNTFRKLAKHVI